MTIGLIGLGKMGANMVKRLLRGGHTVVVYDLNEESIQAAEKEGARGARSLDELVETLTPPRATWMMVPAGEPTDSTIRGLASRLAPGDVIVDGGNSNYKDTRCGAERTWQRKTCSSWTWVRAEACGV